MATLFPIITPPFMETAVNILPLSHVFCLLDPAPTFEKSNPFGSFLVGECNFKNTVVQYLRRLDNNVDSFRETKESE